MGDRPTIAVGPVWASLRGSQEVVAAARAALAVADPTAKHTQAFKSGRWDGVTHLLRGRDNAFLSGLTWRVVEAIKNAGHPRPLVTWPEVPVRQTPFADRLLGMKWDRDYQLDAVEKWMRARRVVIQCPTRGGKTEIAMEGVRRLGERTLWVTHTKELLKQTTQRCMDRLGVQCDIVGGGHYINGNRMVTVGMVQSLVKYPIAWFAQFGCLVMDEAHHAGAATWQKVAAACVNASWRLGLSGTMTIDDPVAALRIEGALGPTYTVATTTGLADLGFVARPRMVLLRPPSDSYPVYEDVREAVCPDWRDDPQGLLGRLGGELFRYAYERGITENVRRNDLIVETAVKHAAAGDKFLVLCNRVSHAEELDDKLSGIVPVYLLTGASDDEDRAQVLASFKRGRLGAILVCTPFFREGVDVPQIDAGFLAGGGESDVAVLQALGRMLTVRPDKPEVLIYDVADGRPLGQERLFGREARAEKDYLGQHYLSRLALYRASGFEVERR